MDSRQLRTLVAIATHGTFARAADVVHVTPSAVSQQVQALEVEFGVPLFERATRPPRLTSQGLQVLAMAQEFLKLEDDTKASLKGERISGKLMLGTVRTSALGLLPRTIQRMRELYPALTVNLRVGMSAALIADVVSGRLDASVVAEGVEIPQSLRWSPFVKEPLLVVAPEGTAISDPVHMLRTLPFVRFRSAVPLANIIDTELSRLGVVTNDIAEIDTIGAIVTCIRERLGVSVVPKVAVQEAGCEGLVKLPFGNPQVTRQIGLVERMATPRGEVISHVHRVLADLCGEHGIPREPGPY